jgi:hypothetical protein
LLKSAANVAYFSEPSKKKVKNLSKNLIYRRQRRKSPA